MHFSRSLAGVALLGVFAAMAFAGAATGAPAQSELATATPVGSSLSGTKLQINKLGVRSLSPGAQKAVEKNPYQAVLAASKQGLLAASASTKTVPKVQRPAALSYKAPTGVNATAAATVDQPIAPKNSAVQSGTGVNAWQQETFGGYNLEPPDPSLCAGQGFVVQVVNSQIQISNGNLQKLTAPISTEAFFADFVNIMFDPQCAFNHSTGRWYYTVGVSDFATFSGVYIAVSTSSDPRGPWNIYFLDLTFFGGDGFCGVGFCLADQPTLGADQYTISISTNQFELTGALPSGGEFAGAAYVLIDKVALALGNPFPNVVAFDISDVPLFPDFLFGDCQTGAPGPCWYSVQGAESANGRYDTRNGGTQWAMSALDFFGAGDNRIAVWQFTNTQSIGAFIPDISGDLGIADIGHATYSPPPLSAQPQTVTGPNTANGNPLGDFLVLAGLCPAGTPPAGCSNPGPIDSGDDRMRDTMMTTLAGGSRIMWGGLGTDSGGRAGIMLFGINLGGSIGSSSLARTWTIHNPSNDVQFPAVSIMDSGLALAAYSVSGAATRPSSAYSVFSTSMAPAAIQIANQGQGVQDGFTQYDVFTPTYRPRWGDYSGAVTMGNSIYFSSEYIPDSNCSLSSFLIDDTCGPSTGGINQSIAPRVDNARKRTFFANWGTSLNKATQAPPHP
jgi:hypothetical protein